MKKVRLVILGLFMGVGGAFSIGAAAQAGCNFHGCSQVPGIECNFHGCPIPPNGGECNFHGCPPPTQQQQAQPQQRPNTEQPNRPDVVFQQSPRANPTDIADCMNKLMYRVVAGYSNPQRTNISEQTAMQACRS